MIIFVKESRNRPCLRKIGKKTFSLHALWKHREGLELQAHPFLTSVLAWSQWPASDPDPFTIWDRVPNYLLKRRVGEPRYWSWNFGWRGKSFSPAGIWTPDHLACSLVTIQTTLSRLHKYKINWRICQDFYLPISLPGQSLIPMAILSFQKRLRNSKKV